MTVHQCAQVCGDLEFSHELSIKKRNQYLLGTKEKGIILKPDYSRGLEYYVDAVFAAGWQ